MEITSENFLNWMKLINIVYPLSREDKFKLRRYLHRQDKLRRQEEIEEALGKEIERDDEC